MQQRKPDSDSLGARKADQTRELTGEDAPRDDAETGSAGNGASDWGADLTGEETPAPEFEEQYKLERDPGDPEDISPDHLEKGFEEPGEEDREYTARPDEELRPITPDLLPSNDPDAAKGK